MSRFILALHAGHNASACIGDDTGVVYAVQEERLSGEKNHWGFPRRALRACMDAVDAKPNDLEVIAYGGHHVLSRYHSRDDVLDSYRRQQSITGRLRQRIAMPAAVLIKRDLGQAKLRDDLASEGFGDVEVRHHDHHDSHAASAHFGLRRDPDAEHLVLTCDGVGDRTCATVSVMGGGRRRELSRTHWAHSLGAVYSWVTFGMGFVPLEHEYKLMGMAPYASAAAAEEVAAIFARFLGLADDGLGFQKRSRRRMNDIHRELFGALEGVRFDHVCAGLQRFTEDLLVSWTERSVAATGIGEVQAAGGVFMNVKANQQIAALDSVDRLSVFPSCGDETLPFGAFYLEAARCWGNEGVAPLESFYLGDSVSEAEAAATARSSGFRVEQPGDMAAAVADLLIAGEPVARCAGRMEFGARALGNRSILADPRNQDVVRVVNQMVKKRDFWMPFAPVVKASRQHDYIVNPKGLESPYMMLTFDTRETFRDLIAAVHNADLTCRPQILPSGMNPDLESIIDAFEARTGVGALLNTSFNEHGYPIVRTPEDALGVLRSTGLRHLQIGSWLVHKT